MGDRKYRPVYMFIFTGLILMVIMMNYSFNLIYYVQNRIYENAVKTLFPVETYFEDNYDENSGSVWVVRNICLAWQRRIKTCYTDG
ncbi:MAG: hypothetical protein ACLS9K_07800 [Lachnospira eligens]